MRLVVTLNFGWIRGSCFGSIFFDFRSPGRPPGLRTWPRSMEFWYVSKSPQTVHDIECTVIAFSAALTQRTLLVELCIVRVFVHIKFHVMMWFSDAHDTLRTSLCVCASDSISVLFVKCICKTRLRRNVTTVICALLRTYYSISVLSFSSFPTSTWLSTAI